MYHKQSTTRYILDLTIDFEIYFLDILQLVRLICVTYSLCLNFLNSNVRTRISWINGLQFLTSNRKIKGSYKTALLREYFIFSSALWWRSNYLNYIYPFFLIPHHSSPFIHSFVIKDKITILLNIIFLHRSEDFS